MLLEDDLTYPKYQRVVKGDNKYKPNELKHVFDTNTGGYVNNEFNCCYYSPVNITGLTFTSNNEVTIIEDDNLIAESLGNSIIKGYHDDEVVLSFKVRVYRDKIPSRKLKNTLFLQLNNMIPVSTVLKHINCPHYTDCLFQRDIFKIYDDMDLLDLHYNINQLNQRISDYQRIKEAYRNGHVDYHEGLKDCYNIQIDNGNIKVEVVDDFTDRINSRIKNLRNELTDLTRLRRRLEQ